MKEVKKFLSKYKLLILFFTGGGIFLEIFLTNSSWDLIVLFLASLWILSIWLYGFGKKVSLGGGLVFLIFCPPMLIFGQELIAGKFAIWAYIFLTIGAAHQFLNSFKGRKL